MIVHIMNICFLGSDCKKEGEILPFVTAWRDLEGVTRSEISQTNTIRSHLHVEPGETKLTKTEIRLVGVDLKCSYHRKKVCNCEAMDVT